MENGNYYLFENNGKRVSVKSKSLVQNFSFNFIKTFLGIIFPLITFPYASRVLGKAGIGKVQFAEAIISYFSLFAGLGISTYGIREVAKCKNDKNKMSSIVNDLFTINIISTFGIYILFAFLIFKVGLFGNYKILLLIQSFGIVFVTLGMDWFFTAIEEYKYVTVRAAIFQIISLVLMFIFVKERDDYIAYSVIFVTANVGSGIFNFFYIRRFVKLRVTISYRLKKHMKPIMYIFCSNIASKVYLSLDKMMLGILSGDVAVGLYAASSQIANALSTILNCIANVTLPRASYYVKDNKLAKFRELVYGGGNFTLLLSIPLAIGLTSVGKEVISIFCGEEFIQAYVPLSILCFNMIIAVMNNMYVSVILIPLNHEKEVLLGTVIGAVANTILNVFFISNWGVVGAATSTLISELLVFTYCIYCVRGEISIKEMCIYIPQYLSASLLFIPIKYFIYNIIEQVLFAMILYIFSSIIIYMVVLLLFRNPYAVIVYEKVKFGVMHKE